MMTPIEEIQCGSVRRSSIKKCASLVQDELQRLHNKVRRTAAVCVSPSGDVTIEDPDTACVGDIVTVVDTGTPLFTLYKLVRDEIWNEVNGRGWRVPKDKARAG